MADHHYHPDAAAHLRDVQEACDRAADTSMTIELACPEATRARIDLRAASDMLYGQMQRVLEERDRMLRELGRREEERQVILQELEGDREDREGMLRELEDTRRRLEEVEGTAEREWRALETDWLMEMEARRDAEAICVALREELREVREQRDRLLREEGMRG